MGDDEQRAAPRREVPREPVDALDVEVVGRLVEQQQLGAVEQQLRERDAPPLAAGQRRDRRVEAVREARRSPTPPSSPSSTARNAASPAHSWSARPPTSSSRIVRRSSSSSPWPSSARSHVARARDARPRPAARRPAISRSSVDLPSPLRADDADPVAGGDAERDVAQHRAAAVALVDVLEVDEVAGATALILPASHRCQRLRCR